MSDDTAENFILKGRIVTMNGTFDTFENGAVYVAGNAIAAVQPADAPAPAGFDAAPTLDTKGTIYPGLIELHNHLSYNALRLWNVPAKYGNRDQWPDHPEYHQLVTGPMKVLGTSKRKDLLAALVRYVESKCLFGGTTTGQGIALSSNAGVESYYKGVVRNVESTGDKALPAARTHIADVAAKDWQKFFDAVSEDRVVILHLSEGKDDKARAHFSALQNGNKWAITNSLAGIHCAALHAEDFDVLAKHKGSMVWSPFSNYLLYGDTAEIEAAVKAGVNVALGSDWSPSGSKNLLGELKVARLAADNRKANLSDRDLVAMVTSTPAKIVKWDKAVGSIERGKRADLLVLKKKDGDAYGTLIAAHENDIELVVIDGVARYGTKAAMNALGATFESVKIAGRDCGVQYHDKAANPDIDSVTLEEATKTLETFLGSLADAAGPPTMKANASLAAESKLSLKLDDSDPRHVQRPLLPFKGHETGWSPAAKAMTAAAKAVPLKALELDPLTVKDDHGFLEICKNEMNLPDWLKAGLKEAF